MFSPNGGRQPENPLKDGASLPKRPLGESPARSALGGGGGSPLLHLHTTAAAESEAEAEAGAGAGAASNNNHHISG